MSVNNHFPEIGIQVVSLSDMVQALHSTVFSEYLCPMFVSICVVSICPAASICRVFVTGRFGAVRRAL